MAALQDIDYFVPRMSSKLVVFLLSAILLCPSASAQSFLEKLESAVREQLGQDKTSGPTEELPAPGAAPVSPVPPTSSILEQSSTEARSAPVETFSVPAPDAPLDSTGAAAPSSGRIYLGLEAEEIGGGGIGVRVTAVSERSPAWKAGFQTNDRILAVNGFAIANMDDMVVQLAKTAPGQTVQFLVSRAGKNIGLTAVLMDADLATRTGTLVEPKLTSGRAWLGLIVNDLTASFRRQFGIQVFRGAAVTRVAENSPARRSDIRAGDVITDANGTPIENSDDLIRWMNGVRPGQPVTFTFYRGGFANSVQVVMEVNPLDAPTSQATGPKTVFKPGSGAAPPTPSPPAPPLDTPALAPQEAIASDPVSQLRQENEQLRSELAKAQQKLEETQRQLNRILETLQKVPN